MQLSPHFTLEEMTASQEAVRKGLDNTPDATVFLALQDTAKHMETVREILGHPIIVSSGYRSPEVNVAVGGRENSAHTTGHAVDFICPGFGSPADVCRRLAAAGVKCDQIIFEGSWCHISFAPAMRNDLLTAHFVAGEKTTYTVGVA